MPGEFDFDDEATAVVNLAELRATRRGKQKHHLLVHVHGTELGRVHRLTQDQLLIGRSADADIWIGDDGVSRRHARLLRQGETYLVEDLNSANGTFVQSARVTQHLLDDGDQVQLGPTAVFRYSITDEDQRELLEQLYSTSVTDALTGARNREYLDSLLVTELSYAKRHQLDLGFIIFDLDHFKQINDTYGHPVGDTVLTEVVRAVRTEVRIEDYLCRYGGEEFVLVLRNVDQVGTAAMAERIRAVIEATPIQHEELTLSVTASLGCSTLQELTSDVTPTDLVQLADRRLYVAKNSGRNRVVSEG